MKKIISILLVALFIISMAGCSAATNEAYDKNYDNAVNSMVGGNGIFGNASYDKAEPESNGAMEEYHPNETVDGEEITGGYVERKVVYTVTTELQTKNLDSAMITINDGIKQHKGYIQSQKQTDNGSIYSKYSHREATMVVRIPSENLELFLSGLQNDNMYTLSLAKDSKDYSTIYYDKEIRIDSLKTQEERLLDMLSQASDLKALLELENRLADIRYEIESLTKEMNIIDSNVDYSTVTIYITEVIKYDEIVEEPITFFERFVEACVDSWNGFVEGAQNFAIWFIYALPTLIILGLITLSIVLILKRKIRRKKAKLAAKEQGEPPVPHKSPKSK